MRHKRLGYTMNREISLTFRPLLFHKTSDTKLSSSEEESIPASSATPQLLRSVCGRRPQSASTPPLFETSHDSF